MNKTLIIGRIVKDSEVKESKSKKKVLCFTIAYDFSKEESCFIDCYFSIKEDSKLPNYVKKGVQVYVDGLLSIKSTKTEKEEYTKQVYLMVNNIELLSSPKQEEKKESKTEDEKYESGLPF